MSKYQTTMFNRYERVKRLIHDVHRHARIFHYTCSKFIEERNKRVLNTKDYARLNPYYIGKISGIDETLFHQIQTTEIIWLHYYQDKHGNVIYVEKWQDMPKDIRYNRNMFFSGHFWKNTKYKPW